MKVENHGGLLEDKDMTVVQVMCYLDQTTFSISHPETDISCCDIIGFKILGYCMYMPD